MSNEKNIQPIYNAEQINRYLKGQMTAAEMHAFEKAALDDPFLADAIDGYTFTQDSDYAAQINSLKKELDEKVRKAPYKTTINPIFKKWYVYAAAAVLLGFISFIAIKYLADKKETLNNIAQANENLENKTITFSSDSTIVSSGTDSNTKKDSLGGNYVFKLSTPKNKTTEPQTLSNGWSKLNDTLKLQNSFIGETETADYAKAKELKKPDSILTDDLASRDSKLKFNIMSDSDSINNNQLRAYKKNSKNEGYNYSGIANFNSFSGRVVDKNNKPLPFVNITANNSNVGTYTDAKGFFNFVSTDSVLNVTAKSIGYGDVTLSLNNRFKVAENKIIMQNQQPMELEEKLIAKATIAFRKSNTLIYDSVGVVEPKDGWDNYDVYVANNLRRPEDLSLKEIHGEVQLVVTIDVEGKISSVEVEKSLTKEADSEAVRLIKEGPQFKLNKGKKGKTRIRIKF